MSETYYKTQESVQEYIQLAQDVSGIELIKKLEKVLPRNSSLLEIGSGPGTDWKLLDEEYQVIGSDFSKEFLKHLKADNPLGSFLELDAISLKTTLKFDGIYSNKVLQHLTDSELIQSIQRQAELLNPQGIICHSFWKGEGTEVFKGLFVNYHDENDLIKYFGDSFEILSINTYQEFDVEDSILIIAQKK